MVQWEPSFWRPSEHARSQRERWTGRYWSFIPMQLTRSAGWAITPETSIRAAQVEARLRSLGTSEAAGAFEGLSRYLIRSEAVASSRIEGVAPSAKQIVLAEMSRADTISGFSDQAAEVAGNIAAVIRAVDTLGEASSVQWSDVEGLQRDLLPHYPHLRQRTSQNWLGGAHLHPGQAEFIPPQPARLPAAIEDLMSFVNGAATGGLIHAALVHAQFETLHPFADGNGRIGRALIHTILTRRGLTHGAVLPISQVLMTWQQRYIAGLTEFRGIAAAAPMTGEDPPAAIPADAGVDAWLRFFLDAADAAVDLAADLMDEIGGILEEYRATVRAHTVQQPRSDAAVWKVIDLLPRAPILTNHIVCTFTGVSAPSARKALHLLEECGVMQQRSVGRGRRGYLATDLLDRLEPAGLPTGPAPRAW